MSKKGGNRRSAVDPVDQDKLVAIWKRAIEHWGKDAFNLGEYDTRKVSQACSAKGIAANAFFIREFGGISSGEILASQFKQSLLEFSRTHNSTALKDDLWAAQIGHRMVCLMSHYRRLRRCPEKLRQCLGTATGQERRTIDELVKLASSQACKKAAEQETFKGLKESDQKNLDTSEQAKTESNEASGSKRELKRQISEVSVDSDGIPMILKSPASSACEKAADERVAQRPLKKQVSDVSLDSEGFPRMLQTPKDTKQHMYS